ncbi:aldehyde oxidase [Thermosipho melanesiensis]|uniref:Aldehyde oxidase and xanthine dehydrogenase, molybdopterin binding n=2 Tax=Thermosipho melanesiensis TaxID=46541 RepID=A6LML7_THEM4|nr:molybdopterin cofactor-binding domain-containing protein [Thermosipho melanesiensis]ABR31168.1 aldehyde oxidase and xanthine dehydrogenase, molybdopterin binding [Thermosipho melanesiensis BI429]APT74257.1 aldehyde oxidase [Thermosipho melanesiensis]OOC36197.1 aldehyde oxidase [Thermosipho melanesiensis]OOC37015.1 aldehyde oxidase [Thermosipho melanesiensis]OOC37767.1 aldehyde oxidase [Thermosipho melanesiensis]
MKEVTRKIPKKDSLGLLLGKPVYTNDLSPKEALVVKVLRSPHAFAEIKNIDTSKAEKIEGIECILTYKDVPKIPITRAGQGYPEPSPHDWYILDKYVRYVGDEVAIIAGKDERCVDEALKKIEVDYEIFEPVLDFEKAENHPSIIHPEKETHPMFEIGFDAQKNIAASYEMEIGNVEEELKKCDVVIKERFYTQAQAHVAFEPHTATSYIDMYGRLIIISSTQVPFHVRRIIAEAFSIPIKDIRVIKPRIGGGFGGKQAIHGEPLVAAVTLKTGKPAKIVYSRKEVFEATYSRHPMRYDITLGASNDGKLKVIDMKGLSDTGAYGEHALTTFMVAGAKTLPLYNKVDAVRFSGKVVYTNKAPGGAFRGYGAIQGNFALESAIDMLAEKLAMDPIEFRKKNMIKEGETSPIFKIMGEGREGVDMIVRSCKLNECIEEGMKLINWKKKFPRKKISETKFRGVGMAIAMQGSGIANIDMGAAVLKLNDDGSFNLLVGATDLGTGSDTILAQIAAEVLNTKTEDIIVYSSDTDITPFDTGAYASSTTYVSGNAVKKAAEKMRKLILKEGSKKLNLNEKNVDFDGKYIFEKDGDKKISLKKLATLLFYTENQKQLVADASYVGEESPPPYMAGFAEVEVDIETGKVMLLNYIGVVDCGVTINPNLAKVQIEGGIVQGIGMALFEDVKYSPSGRLLTNNLMYYKIPSRKDIGNIIVKFIESYEPTGPFGAKSVGEIGIDTPPAAIANAIYNAVGVRINSLPITPEKVLKNNPQG